ncbi:MAG: hypothetical protein WA821_02000 [Anaerolineales bacterium]
MKKTYVIILIAVLLLSTTVTGCSRLNNLFGSNPTPTTHKVKLTRTPPAPGTPRMTRTPRATRTPTITPTVTPTVQSYAPGMFQLG